MNKILSICTAAYNIESYAVRLIESILASHRINNIEMIIVDDGSTDNTQKVIEKYTILYPDSVRYLRKENGGSGSARNEAFKFASGKYLKLVDGDDYVNAEGIQCLIDYLCENDVDMVINDYMTITNNRTNSCTYDRYLKPYDIMNIDNLNKRISFSMHAFTFRTDLITKNNVRLSIGKSYVDQEFMSFVLPYVYSWVYLPKTVYIYQLGRTEQSCSDETKIKKLDHMYYIVNSLADNYSSFAPELVQKDNVKNILLKILINFYDIAIKVTMLSNKKDISELIALDKNVIKENIEINEAAKKSKLIKALRKKDYKNYRTLCFVIRLKHGIYKWLKKYSMIKG